MIEITDNKGNHHVFSITYIKMIEATKTSIRIYFKDNRMETVTIKASQITFS